MPYLDKEKQKEYQRDWIQERRKEWFKINDSCIDCGSKDDLELDHIDPTKKKTHRIWSFSKKKRELELAKCVARCSSCHKKKTVIDQAKEFNSWKYSKLDAEQVIQIRNLKGIKSARELSVLYKIHVRAVYKLWNKESWKHL